MKKRIFKGLSLVVLVVFSLNIINYSVFAETTNNNEIDSITVDLMDNYSYDNLSLEELDTIHTKELEEQGKNIIASNTFQFNATDKKTRGIYIVNVSWKIGYDKNIGLVSYVKASGPIGLHLKSISVTFTWQKTTSYAGGGKIDHVYQNVPTFVIHSTIETGKKYPSKTRLRCTTYGDINAVEEISGGYFSYVDYVVIP